MAVVDSTILEELVAHAREISANAYCPYSSFAVGAAVLASGGQVFGGCNVENASFGLTMCAERNAVFAALAAGLQELKAVAIYTATSVPTPPCGACLQVLNEFGRAIPVIAACDGEKRIETQLDLLLPSAFGKAEFNHLSRTGR